MARLRQAIREKKHPDSKKAAEQVIENNPKDTEIVSTKKLTNIQHVIEGSASSSTGKQLNPKNIQNMVSPMNLFLY